MSSDRVLQGLHLDILLSLLNADRGAFGMAIGNLLEAYPATNDASIVRDALATGIFLLGDDQEVVVATLLVWTYRDRLTELRNGLR
jgi:hypothetical protein